MICVEAVFGEDGIVGIKDGLFGAGFELILVLCAEDDVVQERNI